ncbi:MAG: hypothetical protein KC462_04995 [Cyanobacteria bacterium HKST-UBA05]|nr:hypothetical protein [Cyanobacteria bacterium HKST-UBA05]
MKGALAINTLFKLLDRLESVVMDGIPIPLMPYSLINQEKLILLLDKIQASVPEAVQEADQVLDRRDEIVQDAQREAQQILMEAKRQADLMLSESELMKAVHMEAERVRQQVMAELGAARNKTIEETDALRLEANNEARAIRENADQYAELVFKTVLGQLGEFQNLGQNAQKQLKQIRTAMMQNQNPASTIRSGEAPLQAPPSKGLKQDKKRKTGFGIKRTSTLPPDMLSEAAASSSSSDALSV